MIMTQVGLTVFQYDREHDSYVAVGYTFHLCPQAFGCVDQAFIFQASTLRFLCKHNFDFNKFTYEGLPYLSKAEEANVHQQLKDKSLFNELNTTLEIDDEKQIQNYCSEVSKWLHTSEEGTMYLDVQNPLLRYILHNELRMRFPNVLTTDSLGNSNKVLIYRDKYVEGATSAPMAILEENLLFHLKGFSQIIDLLALYKKPIIGHNIFLDTVLIHNQFIGPLPKKYSDFKKNINNIFPIIFDTKYISHEMRNKLTYDEVWKSNSLRDLYEFFSEGKCKKLESGVNFIRLSTPFNVKQSYHEAGWDSYCSGYCFIRLGHWAACENMGKYRPVGPTEKLTAMAPYCNKVNIIRGAVPYMNLVGEDPPRHRPDLLHVKSVKERVINIGKVAFALSSYGVVDVKAYGKRTALVAAHSHHTADKILKQFKNNSDYKISMYRAYKHSTAGRMTIWGGAIITGGLLVLLLTKKVHK
ncbi:pre-piRNA 3'-exonuclease trimmer-like isoform X2 [Epargyreus clarus]